MWAASSQRQCLLKSIALVPCFCLLVLHIGLIDFGPKEMSSAK